MGQQRGGKPAPHTAGIGRYIAVLLLLGGSAATKGIAVRAADGAAFNTPGNIVIADQFNNRVIEVDPATHHVVWHFGDGSSKPGPTSIVGTNDAERVGTLTLMAGTGVPPAPPLLEPTCKNGCVDNRVILVNERGQIVWQYGQAGVTGAGADQLNTPVQATYLPNNDVLITDQGNERVIEVTPSRQIVWQYGTTGVTGSGPNQLNNPNSAELLANGNILIADENNNRAIEVTPTGHLGGTLVKQFTAQGTTSGVAFASRLPNGDTLLTDSNNSRIVEVDATDTPVWQYFTNARPGSISQPFPTRAVRLANGNTLISDQFNDQVIEVDQGKHLVFSQGRIGVAGDGFNQLNGPYDAKVVGDYTGLTPP